MHEIRMNKQRELLLKIKKEKAKAFQDQADARQKKYEEQRQKDLEEVRRINFINLATKFKMKDLVKGESDAADQLKDPYFHFNINNHHP